MATRWLILVLTVWSLLLAKTTVGAAEPWAPPRTVFVPETGHTIDGLFLDYWREHRDLLGNPITEEIPAEQVWRQGRQEGEIVQYFENAALTYLPQAPLGVQVQLVDLGRDAIEATMPPRPTQAFLRATERTVCAGTRDECRNFTESGHTVRGLFLASWEAEPRGWLGAPLTEAFRAADESIVQYFEHGALRLDRSGMLRPLPSGKLAARAQGLNLTPLPPPAEVPAYDELLFVPPPEEATPKEGDDAWALGTFGPGPQQGAWKEIVVSISAQSLWAYENGELVRSTYVSTGTAEVPETVTPIGYWSILTKFDVQDMEGTISDEYYFVEDVPDVMYFDNLGNALHGTYWHSNFGAPMSHGCVNLPLDVAAWMYEWAPIGTAVSIVA